MGGKPRVNQRGAKLHYVRNLIILLRPEPWRIILPDVLLDLSWSEDAHVDFGIPIPANKRRWTQSREVLLALHVDDLEQRFCFRKHGAVHMLMPFLVADDAGDSHESCFS